MSAVHEHKGCLSVAMQFVEEERKLIEQCLVTHRKKLGDTYYVLSFKWWQLWKDYVGYDQGESPAPFMNSKLLSASLISSKTNGSDRWS